MTDKVVDLSFEAPTFVSTLTQLIVNLLPAAKGALDIAVELSKFSQTDVVNKALQTHVFALMLENSGTEFFMKRDGKYELVEFSKM